MCAEGRGLTKLIFYMAHAAFIVFFNTLKPVVARRPTKAGPQNRWLDLVCLMINKFILAE